MYHAAMLKKELIAASTEPLLLSILARGENYGYALIQKVRETSGGHICWTDGMLYPVLHRLERQGQIKSQWKTSETGRKRKYYSIKNKGRVALDQAQEQWQVVTETLNLLSGPGYVRSRSSHP
jgi:PadR family transcriptional regulator